MSNYRKIIIASLFINLIIWILLLVAIKPTALPIILHYNAFFGTDVFGNWHEVFYLPLAGLIILGINLFLFWLLPQKRIKYFLLSTSLLCQIFLLIGGISIIVVNS